MVARDTDGTGLEELRGNGRMSTKVWNLMYVAGNPEMFTRVTANADNR